MGKWQSDGIAYFPFDTDFFYDDKIRLIRSKFKIRGIYCLLAILCEIYRDKGYYMAITSEKTALLADQIGYGCDIAFVSELLAYSADKEFFDRAVFDSCGVLTSRGIQIRWLRAKLKNTDHVLVDGRFWLLDENDVPAGTLRKVTFKNRAENKENRTETGKNRKVSEQNKRKNKKENNSKVCDDPDLPRFRKLIEDYGLDVIREYERRLATYELNNNKRYPDRIATIEQWLGQDRVPKKPSYDIDFIMQRIEGGPP